MTISFIKMHGAGNDFIVFEDLKEKYKDLGIVAKKLCDRKFGIGADGILVVQKSEVADIKMTIINADGSYAAMCGNGIRCFAKFVYEQGYVSNETIRIETGDGVKIAELIFSDGDIHGVKINMGKPSFNCKDFGCNYNEELINKAFDVNGKRYVFNSMLMGVPHTVIIDNEKKYNVEEGAKIEKYSIFTKGTNVNFCEVISEDHLEVRTWERGAGPTLACGTGCCSAVVAMNKLGLVGKCAKVDTKGGQLFIELTEEGVMMTGPAENICFGKTCLEI